MAARSDVVVGSVELEARADGALQGRSGEACGERVGGLPSFAATACRCAAAPVFTAVAEIAARSLGDILRSRAVTRPPAHSRTASGRPKRANASGVWRR
jgi:hypothetical protein